MIFDYLLALENKKSIPDDYYKTNCKKLLSKLDKMIILMDKCGSCPHNINDVFISTVSNLLKYTSINGVELCELHKLIDDYGIDINIYHVIFESYVPDKCDNVVILLNTIVRIAHYQTIPSNTKILIIQKMFGTIYNNIEYIPKSKRLIDGLILKYDEFIDRIPDLIKYEGMISELRSQ